MGFIGYSHGQRHDRSALCRLCFCIGPFLGQIHIRYQIIHVLYIALVIPWLNPKGIMKTGIPGCERQFMKFRFVTLGENQHTSKLNHSLRRIQSMSYAHASAHVMLRHLFSLRRTD